MSILLGVLAGRAPDVSNCLITMGMHPIDATYCNNCFEDGAVLLLVRTEGNHDKRIALEVIRRYGGIFPPTY
jgi:hypothetical protein